MGPARILCVCPADANHPAGMIEDRTSNLSIGHIDFSDPLARTARDGAWTALCRDYLATHPPRSVAAV
jgi:hypothetical protein